MKKKFWAAPLAACALACTVLLSACGGPSVEELIREDLKTQFEEVTAEDDEFIDAIESSGGAGFDMLDIDAEEYAGAYLDGFDYEIGDVAVDESAGTAEAKVTVTMKSMADIISKFSEESEAWMESVDVTAYASQDELYAEVGKMLMDVTKSAKPKKTEVTFEYEKDDDGVWQAAEGTEAALYDAMM